MMRTPVWHVRPSHTFSLALTLLIVLSGLLSLSIAAADEPIRHSVLIAGPTFTGILDDHGKETWNAGRAGARDAFQLNNGNVLITWGDVVQEIRTSDHQVVFEYRKPAENDELGTAVHLANGRTMITELGKHPRLIEVDANGTCQASVTLLPETENSHMQTRMARKLENGNYLVPHLLAFQVKEYDPTGKVVRAFPTDWPELGGRAAENWPFTAIRLPNGNTLVTLTHGNKVVELDPHGKVVWSLTNDDLPDAPLADPCGAQCLPHEHVVICSYAAQQGIKILEVNRKKEIVWTYEGPHRAHEVQVLTTQGRPVTPPLWK